MRSTTPRALSTRSARAALGRLLVCFGLLVGLFSITVPAEAHTAPEASADFSGTWPPAGTGWQGPIANPAMPAACGMRVALLLDRSTSIEGHQSQYNAAAAAIVNGLSGSPSSVGVWSFGTDSSSGGTATYPAIAFTSVAGGPTSVGAMAVKSKITQVTNAIGSGTQYTNYEAGLAAVRAGAGAAPDLVVMLTDGAPTTHNGASSLTVDVANADVDGGILSANAVKAWSADPARTRLFAVGIGSGVGAGTNAEKVLQLITGPTKFDGANISTADYLLTSFEGAATALGQLAKSLCQATVTVEKRASSTAAPTSYGPGTRTNGWGFASTPAAAAVTPADQQTGIVDGISGRVRYTYDVTGPTDITITETLKSGFTLQGIECTKATPNGAVVVPGTRNGNAYTLTGVQPTDAITCLFKNQPIFVDLSVTKTDGVTTAVPGQVLDYTITYANASDAVIVATGVVLTEVVPQNTTYVAAGSSAWSCADGAPAGTVCTLAVSDLAPGAVGSAHFKVKVVNPIAADVTAIANTVTIAGPGYERDLEDQTATDVDGIDGFVDLTVTKTDGKTSTEPGATNTYVISASTSGSKVATGVVLTETVPANSTFLPATSSPGWSCLPGNAAGATCTLALPDLVPGAAAITRSFAVQVADAVPADVSIIENTVTIAGANETPSAPLPNSASDVDALDTTIDLTVTKSDGGVIAEPGDTVAYTIGYRNDGDQVATGVVLTETVPAHTTFLAAGSPGWDCNGAAAGTGDGAAAGTICTYAVGSLSPSGAATAVTFSVTVAGTLPVSIDSTSNTVTIAGTNEDDPDELTNTATDTTPLDAAAVIEVAKTDGVTSASPGDALLYTITVQNTGNQDAAGVVVRETVPEHTSFLADDPANTGWTKVGDAYLKAMDIAAGQSVVLTFKVQVDASVPANADTIDNLVTACLGEDCDEGDDTDELVADPELSVTKDDGVAVAGPGDTLSYDIDYANTGDREATDLVLTETVPAYTSADPAVLAGLGWDCDDSVPGTAGVLEAGSTCRKDIGDLDGDADGSATFVVSVDDVVPVDAQTVVNLVGLVDGEETVDTDDDVDELTHAAGISVEKTDGVASASAGDVLTYVISVTNTGSRDAVGVSVAETVPEHTQLVENGDGNAAWTDVLGVLVQIVDIPAGETVELRFTVQVDAPLAAGAEEIVNTVVACLDEATCDEDEDVDDLVAAPDLSVTKTDGGATARPGDEVTYTIAYANKGNQDATGVVLTETVPPGSTFVGPDTWTCVGTTCTFVVGELPAGGTGSVSFRVRVSTTVPAAQAQLDNLVVIDDDGENGDDPIPADNTGRDTTPLVRPTEVLPRVITQAPAPQVAAQDLPRTGGDADHLLVLAGLLTIAGGLLLMAESTAAHRRSARRTLR